MLNMQLPYIVRTNSILTQCCVEALLLVPPQGIMILEVTTLTRIHGSGYGFSQTGQIKVSAKRAELVKMHP